MTFQRLSNGQGSQRLVVGANTPNQVALLSGSVATTQAERLAFGPARLHTEVLRNWVGQVRPASILVSYGTDSGQRVHRELAPGESCPVWTTDLSVVLVRQTSNRAGVDLATVLGAEYTAVDLLVAATVEPAANPPSRWIAESVLLPSPVGGGGVAETAIPVGARRWRPVVSPGSTWDSSAPSGAYCLNYRPTQWNALDWLTAAAGGPWIELPPGSTGTLMVIGAPTVADADVGPEDLCVIRWECEP